jgi:copper(I)-binding protein
MPYEEGTAVLRNTRRKTVARRATITAIALLVPVLAGCEAGANAPTLAFHEASGGAHKVVDNISINNVFVLGPPAGSTMTAGTSTGMFLALYNDGTQAEQLVGASAPGTATSVTLKHGAVSIAPGGSALLTGPEPEVVLTGLIKSISGGQTIPVTLNFAHAGPVNLQVPVEPYSFYYTMFSTAPTPTPSPSVSATASPNASSTPKAHKKK